MMYRRVPLVLTVLSLALPAAAQFHPKEIQDAKNDPKMYTIDELSVKVAEEGPVAKPEEIAPPAETGQDPLVVIDHIMNIGARMWQFMLDNQAVVTSTTQYATALPQGVTHWSSMAGWNAPKGTVYRLTAKNAYGMTVVDLRYMVLRTTGGSYEGKGKYLTAVSAQTMPMTGVWGYRVSLEAAAPDSGIVNAGTKTDPLAAMTFVVGWKIQTAIKKAEGNAVYYMRGDGVYQQLGGPFQLKRAESSVAKAREETLRSEL
jgi:hypothetical protein